MFSDNNKISARQIKFLFFMEGIWKTCILLPLCLEKKNVGSVVLCLILGIVFWSVLMRFLFGWMRQGEDLFDAVTRVLGLWPARILYVAGYLFFLAQAAVCLNLCGELAGLYLLPESSLPVLCLLPLVCGIYLSLKDVEVRARFCEITGPVVLLLMAVCVFMCAFGIGGKPVGNIQLSVTDHLAGGGFEVFACLGGMFLPVSGVKMTEEAGGAGQKKRTGKGCDREGEFRGSGNRMEKEKRRRIFGSGRSHKTWAEAGCSGGTAAGILGGSLCAIAVASYGAKGMGAVEFPAVRVMSNVRIPGFFFQRWDILFLALLLTGLFAAVAGSFWYMKEFAARLCGEWTMQETVCDLWEMRKKEETSFRYGQNRGIEEKSRGNRGTEQFRYGIWGAGVIAAYLLAAGFLSSFTAICYYRAYHLQIMTPVLLFFYVLAGIRGRVKTAAKQKETITGERRKTFGYLGKSLVVALIFLAVSVLLIGCTAREPEERLFPMALEIALDQGTAGSEGQLMVTYAWDDTTGPGNASAKAEGNDVQKGILTTFSGDTLMEVRKQVNAFTERYVDYSHVKAIILDESLKRYPELAAEILQWFSGEPAFASGLIVYPRQESGLTLQKAAENCSGQIGIYLEQLYKNNEKYRESSTTLGRVIAEYFA